MPDTTLNTAEWIRRVLSGEEPPETLEHRAIRLSRPETATARFIREALGEPAPAFVSSIQVGALAILLLAERAKRQRSARGV